TLAVNGNTVSPGTTGGGAFGSGMFLAGNGTLTFGPATGETQTISDVIADETGSGFGGTPGSWALSKSGAGTLYLSNANTYSGGTTVTGGTLEIGSNGALGSGALSLQDGTALLLDGVAITNSVTMSGDPDVLVNGTNS